jgi:hypothetical protein
VTCILAPILATSLALPLTPTAWLSFSPHAKTHDCLVRPAQCVEDVDVYDAKTNTIITSNDNNFPYSSSRKAGKADDNELLVLEVPGFFNGGKC